MDLQKAAKKGDLGYIQRNIDTDEWFVSTEYADFELLNIALENQHYNIVEFLLNRGCHVNGPGSCSAENTPLHHAVLLNKKDLVQMLMERKASLEAKNKDGNTALHLAFKRKQHQIIDILLPYSIDHYLVDDYGLSNLHIACTTDHLSIVKQLVEKHRVDINSSVSEKLSSLREYRGYTALHFAIQYSKSEIAQYVIDQGADINIADSGESRPFHLAFRKQNAFILQTLASHPEIRGKNHIDRRGLSYFHIASACNFLDLMEILLKVHDEIQLDIDAQVSEDNSPFAGYTALHFAAENKHKIAVAMLLKNEADFTIQDPSGCSPLHLAFYNENRGIMEMILRMHIFNLGVNPVDDNGISHFHLASILDMPEIITGYITSGCADLETRVNKDSEYWPDCTALHIAVDCGSTVTVHILLEAGANANAVENITGRTPLHFACRLTNYRLANLKSEANIKKAAMFINWFFDSENHPSSVHLLIKYSADLNVRDKAGRTPLLHLYDSKVDRVLTKLCSNVDGEDGDILNTILTERRMIAHELINSGADVNISDKEGMTFLHTLANIQIYDPSICLTLRFTIDKVEDLNVKTKLGLTPLHFAASNGRNESIINELIHSGADPKAIENWMLSAPLHRYIEQFAKFRVSGKLFEDFVRLGADVNHQMKNGKTPLHVFFSRTMADNYAERKLRGSNFSNERVSIFMTLDCDLNAQDYDMRTPLHYAAKRQDEYDVRVLLENGADVDVKDVFGQTPLDYYRKDENSEVTEILMKHVEKLQRIGYHVDEYNQKLAEKIKQKMFSEEVLAGSSQRNFEDEWRELVQLKNKKINQHVSLFDVLYKKRDALAALVRIPKFQEICSDKNFRKDFPLFGGIIKLQFRKGLIRDNFICTVKKSLNVVTGYNLPDRCCGKISDFLSPESIHHLLEVKSVKSLTQPNPLRQLKRKTVTVSPRESKFRRCKKELPYLFSRSDYSAYENKAVSD